MTVPCGHCVFGCRRCRAHRRHATCLPPPRLPQPPRFDISAPKKLRCINGHCATQPFVLKKINGTGCPCAQLLLTQAQRARRGARDCVVVFVLVGCVMLVQVPQWFVSSSSRAALAISPGKLHATLLRCRARAPPCDPVHFARQLVFSMILLALPMATGTRRLVCSFMNTHPQLQAKQATQAHRDCACGGSHPHPHHQHHHHHRNHLRHYHHHH